MDVGTLTILVILALCAIAYQWLSARFDEFAAVKVVQQKVAESDDTIEAKINEVVRVMGKVGYIVHERSGEQLQLVRKKTFNFLAAFLWFLVLGVGLIVYIIWYMAKRDKVRTFTFEDEGKALAVS